MNLKVLKPLRVLGIGVALFSRKHGSNWPFATSDHVVQNPPCWRVTSLLFPHWDIKTKRPEPAKLDLPLF